MGGSDVHAYPGSHTVPLCKSAIFSAAGREAIAIQHVDGMAVSPQYLALVRPSSCESGTLLKTM